MPFVSLYNRIARLLHAPEIVIAMTLNRHGDGRIFTSELLKDRELRSRVFKLLRQSTWK